MPSKRSIRRIATMALAMATGLILLEGLARVADAIGFGSQVVAEIKFRDDGVIDQIRAGRSPLAPDARPILVLGDSMAVSPGVADREVWSYLLAGRLRDEVDPRAVVVNAALPGANTYQELLLARELLPRLRPEVVLVMYNLNDVYGTHGPLGATLPMPPPADAPRPPVPPSATEMAPAEPIAAPLNGQFSLSGSRVSRLVSFLKANSRALQSFLPRVNIQLKARGYLVPGTDYHHMTTQGYRDEHPGWRHARDELAELDRICKAQGARLILFVIPDFDVLKYDHSAEARRILGDYARSIGVPIGFGFENFRGRGAEELAISPFDGHPNPKANRELAKVVADWIASIGVYSKPPAAPRVAH